LFETSYNLGQLPADWKIGNITAVFKKGNKSDPSNYRPITLTSTICKVMESIIRDHIMDFFFQLTTLLKIMARVKIYGRSLDNEVLMWSL